MSIAPSPADLDGDAIGGDGLVEMEREFIRLLLEYDELRTAWPKGGHVLARAKIGRQVADALARIADLENYIIATPARTPAEAAVRRRRLAALGGTAEALSGAREGWDNPLGRLLTSALRAYWCRNGFEQPDRLALGDAPIAPGFALK